MGKGSRARPFEIDKDKFASNWDSIFGKKDKEKDIITREFRDMQITEREVENIKKNLRLGDWNVGATKGLRSYVPETYDQEREEMEREFRREEEKAKLEKRVRKNDKVTERMRDIYADEEEEKKQQDIMQMQQMAQVQPPPQQLQQEQPNLQLAQQVQNPRTMLESQ